MLIGGATKLPFLWVLLGILGGVTAFGLFGLFLGPAVLAALDGPGPAAFLVPVDPEQTYLPKITSRVAPGGSMESNPLHAMSPDLPPAVAARVFRFMPNPYAAA